MRIEYAYSAVSISGTGGQPDTTYSDGANSRPPDIVSLTTSEDMDFDATRTKIASNPLRDDNDYKSALDLMEQQIEQTNQLHEAKILEFTRKLQGYEKGLHANNLGITLPSAPVSASNMKGEINHVMSAMLDRYDKLDDTSKQALMHQAISSNNEVLQSRLMMLRDADKKDGLSLAKLTKEIIKLTDTYKVPELKFDEQVSEQRYNYQTWIMKLHPILAMFPQTASVLPGDSIIPFRDLHSNGNRALYLLLSTRTDSYFQRAIKQHEPFGDKALELIQKQCTHISCEDKSYFHETFICLRIRENESASSFLKRFTYTKTTVEAASNTCTDDQLVDYVLSGICPSKQDVYNTALQLYRLERLRSKKFTLQDIEHNLFQIDEELNGDKWRLCSEHAMATAGRHPKQTYRGSGRPHHGGRGRGCSGRLLRHRTPGAVAAAVTDTTSTIVGYKCGQPRHIAPQCPTNTGTAAGPQQQRPRTAPPARPAQPSACGHVAFA